MKKTLFMETTEIDPSQTVGEIQKILGRYGATHILMEYEGGEVSGVVFNIRGYDSDMPFRLPCKWKAILQILLSRVDTGGHDQDYLEKKKIKLIPQAKRVAWRQILRWIEAQLALVDTNMVKIQEVFMPYLIVNKNQTLFEKLDAINFQIEYKKDKKDAQNRDSF